MELNLNESVRLKLKDSGEQILFKRHQELRKRVPSVGEFKLPATDEDGYISMALWEVMQVFGPYISLGREPPFNTTIRIPEKVSS